MQGLGIVSQGRASLARGLSDEVFLLQRDLHEVWQRAMKKCGKNILGGEDGQCKSPEAGACLAEDSERAGAECSPRRTPVMSSETQPWPAFLERYGHWWGFGFHSEGKVSH